MSNSWYYSQPLTRCVNIQLPPLALTAQTFRAACLSAKLPLLVVLLRPEELCLIGIRLGKIYVAPPDHQLARRIVDGARIANHMQTAKLFETRAREAEEHSSVRRQLLLNEQKRDIGEEIMQTG